MYFLDIFRCIFLGVPIVTQYPYVPVWFHIFYNIKIFQKLNIFFSILATLKGQVFIVDTMLQYCENPDQIINSPALYGELTRHESTVLNIAATKFDSPNNRMGNIDFTPKGLRRSYTYLLLLSRH